MSSGTGGGGPKATCERCNEVDHQEKDCRYRREEDFWRNRKTQAEKDDRELQWRNDLMRPALTKCKRCHGDHKARNCPPAPTEQGEAASASAHGSSHQQATQRSKGKEKEVQQPEATQRPKGKQMEDQQPEATQRAKGKQREDQQIATKHESGTPKAAPQPIQEQPRVAQHGPPDAGSASSAAPRPSHSVAPPLGSVGSPSRPVGQTPRPTVVSGPWQPTQYVGPSSSSVNIPHRDRAATTAPRSHAAAPSGNQFAGRNISNPTPCHTGTFQSSIDPGVGRAPNTGASQSSNRAVEPSEQYPEQDNPIPYDEEIYGTKQGEIVTFNRLQLDQSIKDGVEQANNSLSREANLTKGIRMDFGNVHPPVNQTSVLTNYFVIEKMPEYIYQYEIKYPTVRVKKRETRKGKGIQSSQGSSLPPDQEERVIKQREEKRRIFEALCQDEPQLASTRASWATDYDRIWSIIDLFNDAHLGRSTHTYTVKYTSLSGAPAEIEPVSISFTPPVLSTQAVIAFVQRRSNTLNFGPFATALNALLSKYASASPQSFSVGANKVFLKGGYSQMEVGGKPARPGQAAVPGRPAGLHAHRGYFLSVRPGMGNLLVNINAVTSAFFKPILVSDFITEYLDIPVDREIYETEYRELSRILKGVRVSRTYTRRVTPKNPYINTPDGKRGRIFAIGYAVHSEDNGINVKNYFEGADGPPEINTIRRPKLPAINLAPKTAPAVWVPPELLKIDMFQALRAQLSGDQMAAMIKVALRLPAQNAHLIASEGLETFGVGVQAPGLSKIGFSVNDKLLEVPARFLLPPTIRYANVRENVYLQPGKADWNLMANPKFTRTYAIETIAVLNVRTGYKAYPASERFTNMLQNTLREHGIDINQSRIPSAPIDAYETYEPDDLERKVKEVFGREPILNARLVVVVLSEYNVNAHAVVRRVADMHSGKWTVCCCGNKIQRIDSMYLANLAMKINLKTGGSNHALMADETRLLTAGDTVDTIIVGADVTHPGGSIPGCPSIASVVGTVDRDFVKYCGSMRLQLSRQEVIDSLADMLKERLLEWSEKMSKRKSLPSRILFYRDGVSEGQYDKVRNVEIAQILPAYQAAAEALGIESPEPIITFVVVGKRHHTRFFPRKAADMIPTRPAEAAKPPGPHGRGGQPAKEKKVNGNVKPGLVVEQIITHPYDNDFYLQSHAPIQGQGRPAHYYVLRNDMALTSAQLQKLTNALCFIYARATKGVSYCAPAYYADRLCDRGREYLRDFLVGNNRDLQVQRLSTDDNVNKAFEQRVLDAVRRNPYWCLRPERANPWHERLDGTMFYL